MDAHAGAFTGCEEACNQVFLGTADDPAIDIGGDAAHAVVRSRLDGCRVVNNVHAQEVHGDFANLGQPGQDFLAAQVTQVEQDALAIVANAAPFVDLGLLGTADKIARCQFHLIGRVTLHEALTLVVDQVATFTTTGLAHQNPVAIDAGGVELHKLHIHQRHASVVGNGDAVAGVGGGIGR